jgi:hypothetical protein
VLLLQQENCRVLGGEVGLCHFVYYHPPSFVVTIKCRELQGPRYRGRDAQALNHPAFTCTYGPSTAGSCWHSALCLQHPLDVSLTRSCMMMDSTLHYCGLDTDVILLLVAQHPWSSQVARLEEARRKAVACWNKPAGMDLLAGLPSHMCCTTDCSLA